MGRSALGGRGSLGTKRGVEESASVDEGRLAEARLAYKLKVKVTVQTQATKTKAYPCT